MSTWARHAPVPRPLCLPQDRFKAKTQKGTKKCFFKRSQGKRCLKNLRSASMHCIIIFSKTMKTVRLSAVQGTIGGGIKTQWPAQKSKRGGGGGGNDSSLSSCGRWRQLWQYQPEVQISGALPPSSHRSYGVRARRSKILVVENLDGAGVEVSNFWRQGDQIFLEKSAVTK